MRRARRARKRVAATRLGNDPTAIRAYAEGGFDEVYIGQAGGEHDGFFEFYANTVLPRLQEG